MKNLYFLCLIPFLLVSCKGRITESATNKSLADSVVIADFELLKKNFIDELWRTYPAWATGSGFHNYDSLLIVPDKEERTAELVFADGVDSALTKVEFDKLDANNKTDYRLIANFTKGLRFGINEFKSYEWDPSEYNISDAVFQVMDYRQNSLEDKIHLLGLKLGNVPAYYAAARQNIKLPTKEHTQLAVMQNQAALSFLKSVCKDSLAQAKISKEEKAAFNAVANKAIKSIADYVAWLRSSFPESDPAKFRSFRIGKELYAKKFSLNVESKYTAEQMYQKAVERKQYLHTEMEKLADGLWPVYFGNTPAPDSGLLKVKRLIDKISEQHCKRTEFLASIEKQLPELTAFINQHNLIDLDSTKPLKVRKTPEYADGVAGASINSPGPYDKDAITYYNVTPLNGYSEKEAESYLREYNNYVLQILNIHEAIPGHYTQGIYANRSPGIIKAILGNGATIEGWACYVERMMIEAGYNRSPEMLLFYYKWNLREVCNFILDYNIHCTNWSRQQVNDLLVGEAFQQTEEAAGKWRRATLSQVQLTTYFTGLTEIYELREELRAKKGAEFDLKKFHEQFLSYGSAPVKEIAKLMQ